MDPSQLGYDLLPPDPGVISPDLALDAALSPVVDYGEPAIEPLGRGWAFDFNAGQFVAAGRAPAAVYDIDNLVVWIEKTLQTARYAHAIYSDSYGMDDPFSPVGQVATDELVSSYQNQITEALSVHDRILAVENFSYLIDPMSDSLAVSFSVLLDGSPQLSISAGPIILPGVPNS